MRFTDEDFAAEHQRVARIKRCVIGLILSEVDEDERAFLEAKLALPSEEMSPGAIACNLRKHGWTVTPNQVIAHRKRQCRDFKS